MLADGDRSADGHRVDGQSLGAHVNGVDVADQASRAIIDHHDVAELYPGDVIDHERRDGAGRQPGGERSPPALGGHRHLVAPGPYIDAVDLQQRNRS